MDKQDLPEQKELSENLQTENLQSKKQSVAQQATLASPTGEKETGRPMQNGTKGAELNSASFKAPFSYSRLFVSTFIISAFTVGGGFVIIPLLKAKYVDEYGWLKENESLDLVSIAQSAPGVVAANAAIIMGFRLAGLTGTLVALLATVLPPLIVLTLISYWYGAFAANPYVRMLLKGMQCGVTAVLLDVVLGLVTKQIRKKLILPLAIMAGTFIASSVFGVNIMKVILVDALIGLFLMRSPMYD